MADDTRAGQEQHSDLRDVNHAASLGASLAVDHGHDHDHDHDPSSTTTSLTKAPNNDSNDLTAIANDDGRDDDDFDDGEENEENPDADVDPHLTSGHGKGGYGEHAERRKSFHAGESGSRSRKVSRDDGGKGGKREKGGKDGGEGGDGGEDGGEEEMEDVIIIDWDGPDDPCNPRKCVLYLFLFYAITDMNSPRLSSSFGRPPNLSPLSISHLPSHPLFAIPHNYLSPNLASSQHPIHALTAGPTKRNGPPPPSSPPSPSCPRSPPP